MGAAPLEWSRDQGIGGDLDYAHRELIGLYNRIAWAVQNGAEIADIRERVRSFLIYARWHFGDEEQLMLVCNYPDLVDHKADHQRLLQDAEDFIANLGSTLNSPDSSAVAEYFKYWLSRHMDTHDTKVRDFLSNLRAEQLAKK